MKILCIIDSLGSGGAQRQMVELAKGFKEKGHEVSFLTYHEINFFKPELDGREIVVSTIIEANYLKRILTVRKYIRVQKPDAVIAFLQGASFIATISGFPYRKWKLIVGERSANPNILSSKRLKLYRWFHLFSDYVVANSHANLSLVKKVNPFLKEKKLKVIYNMVNVSNAQTVANSYTTIKTKITIAASYRPVKNLEGLIAALTTLTPDFLNRLEINWYGNIEDIEYEKRMREMIVKNSLEDVINLNSAVKNIFQKYTDSDFVGLFSHYEGFPNTICEAMAMGKPVIVTNVSDIPLFVKDKINGFICNSKDNDSIQTALKKAILSSEVDRIAMGEENKRLSVENFSRDVILSNYLNLLENEE